jgi:hypothetical protein
MASRKEDRNEDTTITSSPSQSSKSRIQQQREQQQQSVNRALDETKDNVRKATDEARREIPHYTQAVNEYQERTIHAAREIADNYIESQKEIINSLQSAWVPQIENAYATFWNYWLSPRRMMEIYARTVSSIADNSIAITRLTNNTIFANMEAFKSCIQHERDNAKEFSRINVNTAKTFEQALRDTAREGEGSNYYQSYAPRGSYSGEAEQQRERRY